MSVCSLCILPMFLIIKPKNRSGFPYWSRKPLQEYPSVSLPSRAAGVFLIWGKPKTETAFPHFWGQSIKHGLILFLGKL